jgi:hypothetical protein
MSSPACSIFHRSAAMAASCSAVNRCSASQIATSAADWACTAGAQAQRVQGRSRAGAQRVQGRSGAGAARASGDLRCTFVCACVRVRACACARERVSVSPCVCARACEEGALHLVPDGDWRHCGGR